MARKRNRTTRLLESVPLAEREFSTDQRKKMAGKGQAMSGGGFPIASEQDLKNAVQAYGRAGDKAAAKAHIIKRARALGLTKLLPDGWLDSMSEAAYPDDEDDAIDEVDEVVSESETDISARPAPARADPASAGAPVEISESDAAILGILEAKKGETPKGNAWDVLLIKAGTSGNNRHYPAAMLEKAVPLFEGARAYADHPTRDEARNRPERSVRDVVGWFEGVRWDTAEEGIRGTFRILESADWLRSALKSAWDAGKKDLLGFSINALGSLGGKRADGSTLIEAIEKVVSTDVVTTPGAGGRLLGVLESERSSESDMDPEEIKRLIQEALAASTTSLMEAFDAKLDAKVATLAPPAPPAPEPKVEPIVEGTVTAATSTPDPNVVALTEAQGILAEIKKQNRIQAVSARVDAAKLPAVHTARVKARLLEAAGKRDVEDTEIDAEIQFVRDTLAESGPARPGWSGGSVEVGDSSRDQMKKALIGWFEGEKVDGVQPVRDLKESYVRWSGKGYYDVSHMDFFKAFLGGYDSENDHTRITESLSTADWSSVFNDVFYLQMIKAYMANPVYDQWRKFVSDIEGPSDFRTRHYARRGGYGDLADVAELGTYPEMTTPGDEDTSYAISKKGGIESVSLEAIRNDRLQQVRLMPRDMGYAAARTLYKFVLDMITTDNPTLGYDSTALYHSTHANTGTTALTVSGVDAVNVAMRSHTAYGQSLEILGQRNRPRWIIVPNELESLAQRVLNPSDSYLAHVTNAGTDATVDPARWRSANIDYHVYDQLQDANDWWVVADPMQVPTMVMGFLDGRQEPELFTQDQANVGSVFSADRVSYKVRHIYGGTVLEHRSMYRMEVT